jgi:hypothetical protein
MSMNTPVLRKLIRLILEDESHDKEEGPDDLLTEPDLPPNEDEEQNEMSAVGTAGGTAPAGAMRGATAPLGSSPVQKKDKKKSKKNSSKASSSNGKDTVGTRSFGGGSKL